ncbi:ATP-binding protein [Paenibacillus pasadenensis]|uniref:ATP-binding protein n=1 Tax=Paenibacillus pasadenensis TaxID=217090 RepID=UPI00203B7C67|nr:ATP-binding protein [Paenibacillus pasadenensis]MCM3748489.1 ATP-binding protein [Paenibacillus pasadenensis]
MIPYLSMNHLLYFLLAYTIVAFASFTMLSIAGSLGIKQSKRTYWQLGGAIVFSLGAWSMHFITMLAYNFVQTVGPLTILPLFVIGGAAYLALLVYSGGGDRPSIARQLSASLLLTTGLSSLNFFCIISYRASLQIDPIYLGTALICCFGAAFTSVYLQQKNGPRFRIAGSLVLGTGAILLQVLTMAGTRFYGESAMLGYQMDNYLLFMGLLLALAAVIIFAFSIMACLADRRYGLINERYRLLVENSIDMIAVVSGTTWEFVNRSGLSMFEVYDESRMVGRSIFDFLHPDYHEKLRMHLHRHQTSKAAHRGKVENSPPIELDWVTGTGRLISTELILSESTFAGKPVVVIIIRDISERKKNEELLINSEKLYVAGQLAAGIAHEIRNPLTSLKGFLQLIASGRTSASGYYDIMKSELNRIETIVSELLMLSKPQVYEMDFADVRSMMLDTVLLLESQAALYGIVVKADYGKEPLWIYGVDSQIKQVFINVLKNAIEVMQDGGEIEISLRRDHSEVLISVMDMGPGIDEEQLAKMGQPFYTTKDKGTGLGLMVSYKIVDNHKGRIRVASQLGTGTTFEIRLPFRNHSSKSSFQVMPEDGVSAG